MVDTADLDKVLDDAGLTNPSVREYVKHWASITRPARVEVVNASDDARLTAEALEAGELLPVTGGRTYSRSYFKDTARAEERTIVATSDPRDKGVYNNWQDSTAAKENYLSLVTGASEGKTMYVVPYLMAPQGSPLEKFAAGVELTDARTVVLHMIRMSRVGVRYLNELAEPDFFVRAVHVTGDLPNLGQGTPDDKRYFYTIADERMINHFGSSYGGNALLGKIAHGLRQGSYDGWKNGFLVEQFLLLGIKDKQTGKTYNVVGGFPSASGKTNLSMTLAPDSLSDRYEIEFYGDDIAWLWPDEDGKQLLAFNPEFGVFGVAKDTNEHSNPTAMQAIVPGTGTIFTNVAYNELTQDVWWEGKTKNPPADLDGWLDWKGNRIADRSAEQADEPWAHPNSRFTTTMKNVPNLAAKYPEPTGVPVDAIIFGGRTRDREPLVRAITDVAEGVYDGLTLGAEATFAADGLEGVLRYDPMSMRPFMSYGEGDYAQHWLDVIGACSEKPIFAHVNWFQRDPEDGHFLWPGYRENVRALVWLIENRLGNVKGNETAVGVIPAREELNLEGLEAEPGDIDKLLTIDARRWQQEMGYRKEHLEQFDRLPQEIWDAHQRVAAAVDEAAEND